LTGLDKIISEILQESEKEAQAIVAVATVRAEEILEEARQTGSTVSDRLDAMYDKKAEALASGFESALALQRRRAELSARQHLIAETLQVAKTTLCHLPEDAYFDLLIKLAAKAAHAAEGVYFLNTRDSGRLPADFEARLNAAIPTGATLRRGGKTVDIDGGLVLEYGNVVENCAIDAIFDARADAFSDIIQGVMMGTQA